MFDEPFVTFFALLFCVSPALILSIIVGARGKSFLAGLKLFLLLALFPVGFVSLFWYYQKFIPVQVKEALEISLSIISVLFYFGTVFIGTINISNAGELLPNGESKDRRGLKYFAPAMLLAWVYFALLSPLIEGDLPTDMSYFLGRNAYWLVFSVLLIVQDFLSFEMRSKGFIARGRVLKYSDMDSVKWENTLHKEKLSIRMTSTGKAFSVKVPPDMLMSVDDLIRENFKD